MSKLEKDYNYDYPIRAIRHGEWEIKVRQMRKDEMPDDGITYYCEKDGTIYDENEKDFELIKDNQQENTMRERLEEEISEIVSSVRLPNPFEDGHDEMSLFDFSMGDGKHEEGIILSEKIIDYIEKETALARKEAIEECIEFVGKMKLGGHMYEEQRIFAGGYDEAIDKTLKALSDIKNK